MNRSTVGLILDADADAKERATLDTFKREGIDLGAPTRMHFTIQDAEELGAIEDELDICQECGLQDGYHDHNCMSDPAYVRYWEHVFEQRRLGER